MENGLIIGPFPKAKYTNTSAPFERGDRLLLYTDGIVGATGPDGEEFGLENVAGLLRATKNAMLGEFIQQLFQKISGAIPTR